MKTNQGRQRGKDRRAEHIALIGIEGSGKSTCYENLMKMLATDTNVAGIADASLVRIFRGGLVTPKELSRAGNKLALGLILKMRKRKFLYEISKLLESIERSKIHETLEERYKPEIVITDGAPLIDMLAWLRFHHPEHFPVNHYATLIMYLTQRGRLNLRKSLFFLLRIPELYVIKNIYHTRFFMPDKVIFLKASAQNALARIRARREGEQVNENADSLRQWQDAYSFNLKHLQKEYGLKVFEIDTNNLSQEEAIAECLDITVPGEDVADVNIFATAISGSMRGWKKLDRMEAEFKKYKENSKVFIVDTPEQAYARAKSAVVAGAKCLVSAGGAGTFNSVLEGCCAYGPPAENMRLAVLRHGDGDLMANVLNIPEDLEGAVKVICEGIKQDKTAESDVLEVAVAEDGKHRRYHIIGFGGAGLVDAPYFIEGGLITYYRRILMAVMRQYRRRKKQEKLRYNIIADGKQMSSDEFGSILILNGDLGRHFPVARGVALGGGDFQVVLFKEGGLKVTYQQIIHAGRGDLERYKDKLGVEIFRTSHLKIIPEHEERYFLNLDGALKQVKGDIECGVYGKIKLITG